MKTSLILVWIGLLMAGSQLARAATLIPTGMARVEINPTSPVRLMGYASRHTESTNVHSAIHARALALGEGSETAVLITADNCILPGAITEAVRRQLQAAAGIAPERIAVVVNHTHNAPSLKGAAPNLFVEDLPAEESRHIDDYTRLFTERLVAVALSALTNREPAQLTWGSGRASFAANRRTPGGPVDHDVPLLRILSPKGELRGVLLNYACHCTTLGDFNQTHPDWTGVCARELEAAHPGTIALVAVGCGADANPEPRGSVAFVEAHGRELAREAEQIQRQPLQEITSAPICRLETIQLPFQPHFSRQQWEARATNSGIVGFHARKWLARLDRGETLPATLAYPVQTWVFGDALAMVFLGGEVVVDYSLRLKQELDPRRVWVNAYANDVPCYIPSRRILREGGYEAESSLWYYDRPQQLSLEVEDLIIRTVRGQLPGSYLANHRELDHPPAMEAEASRRLMRVPPGLRVELVAAEPLVKSPVAVDFAADGSLWVAEMADYPEGVDGHGKPGGGIKRLRDMDGDGRFDAAEIWADDLPFPTGLIAWQDGILVGAAPDLISIQPDSSIPDRIGANGARIKGTRRQVLFTGFATHNFQARVNGLRWGYDGWIYGSGGIFGGKIQGVVSGLSWEGSGRDFRFRSPSEFESLAGVSQQGRTRDDFGNWFGNDNSTLLWHYPFPDIYASLNPEVARPDPRVSLARGTDSSRVFPRSRLLERFNDFDAANHLTSACGPEIYRDTSLGESYYGNAFVCEPVHNLVRRAVLEREGPSFGAVRAALDRRAEFLASADHWFRPVEVRTGPDGGLWVVDFYREVIEHPRWIPAERLKDLNPRGGADRGRIYRIVPEGAPPLALPRVSGGTLPELARFLASTNGVLRDLADRELRRRHAASPKATDALKQWAELEPSLPPLGSAVRVQWEWLRRSEPEAANPPPPLNFARMDPRARRALLPLLELTGSPAKFPEPIGYRALMADPDPGVRYQLALTTGRLLSLFRPAPAWLQGIVLGLTQQPLTNRWHRAALLAAAGQVSTVELSDILRNLRVNQQPEFTTGILRTAAHRNDPELGALVTETLFGSAQSLVGSLEAEAFQWYSLVAEVPGLGDRMSQAAGARGAKWSALSVELRSRARPMVLNAEAALETRVSAARVLAQARERREVMDLVALLAEPLPNPIREVLRAGLGRTEEAELSAALLSGWPNLGPAARAERVEMLMGRENSLGKLLAAIQRGEVSVADLTPAQRQTARNHISPAIRTQAVGIFPPPSTDRAGVVGRYAGLDIDAAPAHLGLAVFEKNCATCHRLRGIGSAVGPDLTAFRGKPVADFLVAIFDPNVAIEPRYTAQVVETRDGRTFTGIVDAESSAGFTLHQPGGLTELLARREVLRLTPAVQSLMPEGLEQALSREDVAALLHWIRSTPGPMGGTGVAQGLAAQRALAAEGISRVRSISATEPVLSYASWLSPLPLRYCRETDGHSALRWEARPLPAASTGPGMRFRFAAASGFISEPAGGFRLRIAAQPEIVLEATVDDATWKSADGRVTVRFLAREQSAEDACGILEIELTEPPRGGAGDWVRCELTGAAAGSQRWFGLYDVPGTLE